MQFPFLQLHFVETHNPDRVHTHETSLHCHFIDGGVQEDDKAGANGCVTSPIPRRMILFPILLLKCIYLPAILENR